MRPDAAISIPAYQDTLRWLYGFSPNVRTAADIVADHERKLPRMRALLAALGHPERTFQSVSIGGTKGKGSTAAQLAAILHAAGRRVGLATSPHLVSWCERVRLGERDITPEEVVALTPQVRAAAERVVQVHPDVGGLTTFEVGLGLTLLAFARNGVELAVVEVGVGGAHDATNALDPLFVGLTTVSYDHMATLGPTLTHIATEKAGTFRPGRLVVVGPQPEEAMAAIRRVGDARTAHLELVGRDWGWQPEGARPGCGSFAVRGMRGRFEHLALPLLGRHQRDNATVAVALATAILGTAPPRAPDSVSEARYGCIERAVRKGLAAVRWPGRLQVLRERPCVVADGAHNGDSAVKLVAALRECFGATRYHLVFGSSVGKDLDRMLTALLPGAATVTLTRSQHERSVPLEALAQVVRDRGATPVIVPDVRPAVEAAIARAAPEEVVVITGSLFVVGEALADPPPNAPSMLDAPSREDA
ncbi:MAG: bifunctional folylpolyglutamate synthase/dihydrofolate synthase [Chloroflexi bacterium]|nr:bifunctional folylpolyglutamate synthase/dihydrofolate synthase [Chloroflexota bacterium]